MLLLFLFTGHDEDDHPGYCCSSVHQHVNCTIFSGIGKCKYNNKKSEDKQQM